MLAILNITAPIFIIIALGFYAIRLKILAKEELKALGSFVITFALPSLLFNAMRKQSSGLIDVDLFTAYTIASLLIAGAVIAYTTLLRRDSLTHGSVLAMGASVSNSAYIGYPIAHQMLGAKASTMLAIYFCVESLIMLPLLMVLAEIDVRSLRSLPNTILEIFRRLSKNPMLIGILAGFSVNQLSLDVPEILSKPIDMLANSSGAVALFYIGGTLAGANLRGLNSDMSVVLVAKLIIHPLVLGATFLTLPDVDSQLKNAAILNSAMPMASIYPILGQRYGKASLCTVALVSTTAVSFFTISAMLWFAGAPT